MINLGTVSTHDTLVSRDIRLTNLTSQVMSSVRLVDTLTTDQDRVEEKEEKMNTYDILPGTNAYVLFERFS